MNTQNMLAEIELSEIAEEKLNVEQIIDNLGGIRNVIEHCLNDSTYCENNGITQENIQTLHQLVIGSNSDVNIQVTDNDNQLLTDAQQSPLISPQEQAQIAPQGPRMSQNVPMYTFKKLKIIFTADEDNNLYFKCLPDDIAYFIQYKILLNNTQNIK